MTVASCPSCRESVTVPVDATPDCIVRCPLCHEEFKLEAFLTQLPPALIVLEDEKGPADPTSPNESPHWEDSAGQALASWNVSQKPGEASDSVPAFDFTPGSTGDGSQEGATGIARRAGRHQKNATVEVLKIVAGGLLAIPAAQLILWWFVPGDWKRDLLGIGPGVSRVVPWIVPRKFHGPEEVLTREPSFEPEWDASRTVLPRRQARPRSSNGSAITPFGSGSQAAKRDASSEQSAVEDFAATEAEPNSAHAAAPDSELPTPSPAPAIAPATKKFVQGVRDAPQATLSDLRAAFEAALQASIAWDTNPDQSEQRRAELTHQFYVALTKLGETITFIVPTGDPAERDLVTGIRDVLVTFAQHPKKLAMIGNYSSQWLDQSDRPNQGVFLFGTVKQIQSGTHIFETELELGSLQKRTVTVVSRLDPHPFYETDDRVLMLGAIVLDPAQNLLGYDGQEPLVVMGGLPIVLKP